MDKNVVTKIRPKNSARLDFQFKNICIIIPMNMNFNQYFDREKPDIFFNLLCSCFLFLSQFQPPLNIHILYVLCLEEENALSLDWWECKHLGLLWHTKCLPSGACRQKPLGGTVGGVSCVLPASPSTPGGRKEATCFPLCQSGRLHPCASHIHPSHPLHLVSLGCLLNTNCLSCVSVRVSA